MMVRLAEDREFYEGVREKVERNKMEVFDTARWVAELEEKLLKG